LIEVAIALREGENEVELEKIEKRTENIEVCGEIVGKTIYIYNEEQGAIKTLRHDMIEHLFYTYE